MDKQTKKGILQSIKDMLTGNNKPKKNNVPDVDLNRYVELEDMYGYIGFIDEYGGFYRVREIGKANGGHGEWAYFYLDQHKDLHIKPSLNLTKNAYLLLNQGWALLYENALDKENSIIAGVPEPDGGSLTPKQKEVMENLIEHQNAKAKKAQLESFNNGEYKSTTAHRK